MRVLNLDKIKTGLSGITPARGFLYMEAAIVSLMKRGYSSGVILKIEGDFMIEMRIEWTEKVTQSTVDSWKEERYVANYGAVGIALLLYTELLGISYFEEAQIGTGIDFWVSKQGVGNEDALYIPKDARLEISGLGKEKVGNTVNMRIGQKKRQITSSDITNLPGWIIVVEFMTPKSKIIKK